MPTLKPKNVYQRQVQIDAEVNCVHCGDSCIKTFYEWDGKAFCCQGCQTVYEILHQHDLDDYYRLETTPGIRRGSDAYANYAYLDDEKIISQLISFTDGDLTHVSFHIPQIHCSSCIWLLENLNHLDAGILSSRVNFLRKDIFITYSSQAISLRQIVELLFRIGYAPSLKLDSLEKKSTPHANRTFYVQLGIAGFCFGNIMLLSLPEYLAADRISFTEFQHFWGYINLLLAIPVLLISSKPFFKGAFTGLSQGHLNIDVPIALGILALFGRSAVDILWQFGPGYMDSLAGLVFFLLIGRWFQHKTYDVLSFDRDYTSYFPIHSQKVLADGKETAVTLPDLRIGDIIRLRNYELVPADGIVRSEEAQVDYSFVTGESDDVFLQKGERIYAGGRLMGSEVDIQLVKQVSQSYLTQLWNKEESPTKASVASRLIDQMASRFTWIILGIAAISGIYWMLEEPSQTVHVITSILIIACPCGLALSAPIIYGHLMRIMGKRQCYVKHTAVLERLAQITHIVLDKTGTLTLEKPKQVYTDSLNLSPEERAWVYATALQSAHPMSQALVFGLYPDQHSHESSLHVEEVNEFLGEGVSAWVEEHEVRIGTQAFCLATQPSSAVSQPNNQSIHGTEYSSEAIPLTAEGLPAQDEEEAKPGKFHDASATYVSIDRKDKGTFEVEAVYREGLSNWIARLKMGGYQLSLLSGDKPKVYRALAKILGAGVPTKFGQVPADKQAYVGELQASGERVLMMGDGLNDAGALRQSEVGVAVSENRHQFSPACDIILDQHYFHDFPHWLKLAKVGRKLLHVSIGLSLLYNTVGLVFAICGLLSPLVAAILMPVSSISVVLFGTVSVYIAYNWVKA